ncbi:hypothetical protein FA13DRAFT_1735169 [Coprinellus micaceus]|uniref:MYND-type domain-containing protein n=1 Tax=Coprinellus micaceus TaxID=71717 RepID=A0A4Y7T4G9_COPMI|nr:hypothetical protein FA13DRAFT_1735169 [Coprinellus micaceus]
MAFRNFVGLFRDPSMNYTEATTPEAYKFFASFRPSHAREKDFERFTSPDAKFLLKCLQIVACMTLGLLAWDAKDQALDLAATDPTFSSPTPAAGLETWIQADLQQAKDNLAMLIQNDETNSLGGRREVLNVPNVRVNAGEGDAPSQEGQFVTATDACGNCGTRGKMPYCGAQCQKAHWKTHKLACAAP